MKFHSKFEYRVYLGKAYSSFDSYRDARGYYKEKKEAGGKNVKLVEIRTDVTETVMES